MSDGLTAAIGREGTIQHTLDLIGDEVCKAMRKHRGMNSAHEAYGVILEEVEEFWDEVRKQSLDRDATRKELIQIAAMCVRAIHDLNI